MTQSIIIFVIIMIVQAIATAAAKKAQAQKAAQQQLKEAKGRVPMSHSGEVEVRQARATPPATPQRVVPPIAPARLAVEPVPVSVPVADQRVSRPLLQAVPLHVASGESTAVDLARTVAAIHEGILRKPSVPPLPRVAVSRSVALDASSTSPKTSAIPRNRQGWRRAMVASEVLAPPLALR